MISTLRVSDYMSTRLVTLTEGMGVFDAIKTLLNNKITSAPVLDGNGLLLGMFSEKDGLKVFLESIYDQGVSGKVGEYMNTQVPHVSADLSIVDLAEKFQNSPIRSFPVYKNEKFVGVISRVDVLKALIAL